MSGAADTGATPAPATSDTPTPTATSSTNSTTSTTGNIDSMGVLNMSEQTQQTVITMFAATICGVVVAVTLTLCYRVWVDGDAPLTSDITHQLVSVLPWLVGALVTAIIGQQSAKALLAKVLP